MKRAYIGRRREIALMTKATSLSRVFSQEGSETENYVYYLDLEPSDGRLSYRRLLLCVHTTRKVLHGKLYVRLHCACKQQDALYSRILSMTPVMPFR